MEVVFGGAYQGKLDYIKSAYKLDDNNLYMCSKDIAHIDFNKKVIVNMENIVFSFSKENRDPILLYKECRLELSDKIIVFNDMLSGNIPDDPLIRKWHVDTGKFMTYLCNSAEKVTRVFCGMPQIIKG